ncbi:MAG: hypothetical protein WC702_01640 [Patescibacteria group bacterium]|jgi:hypothetical protein
MKNAFKKAFTGAVAVLTIVWSVGIANLPMTAHAASAGDVIKGTTLSTVYYYGGDGSRYAFPNEKTYFSWYADFSDVETISDSALAAIPLAGNIVYRPGSHWIKIQSDPKTYAPTPDGTIRWIETEDVAEGLAGADWNAFIDDVSDTFFVDYTVGTSLMSASDAYEGALVKDGSDTYLIWDGEKHLIDAMSDNNFQTRLVLDGSGIDLDGITTGSAITAESAELVDTAQQGGISVSTGGLSISLASDSPASVTIPSSADSVEVATFKVTATEGAATIDQMIFRLGGVGATANISNTYLYEGTDRLTNARSINSTTREVTFGSLDLDFTDGETKYLTVRIDVAAAATVASGDTVNFTLVEAADVVTDNDVSGNFPISGNTMTFSDTVAGTLTVTKNGSITNPTIGQEQATLAKVKFAAATEGASLEQVMFDVDNAGDHDNFTLYDGADLLSEGTVDGKKVTFILTEPLVIEKGGDQTLYVKADVGGESAEVISVAIEESADVMAIGSIYGFNMGIDVTGYDETGNASCSTQCSESTIQGGDLTFAFNGPTSTDIAVDSADQVLLEFTLTSANWTQLQHLPIILNIGTGADDAADDDDLLNNTSDGANYTDISIRESDGTVWMGPEELSVTNASASHADDQTQTLTFDDYQDLQAGDSLDLMVTVDVDSDTDLNADLVRATIDVSLVTAEDANGDALTNSTDIVPTADISGYYMTITTSSLTVDESSTPSAGTYVIGTAAVPVVGYAFTAAESSSITISEATYMVAGDSDATYTPDVDLVPSDHISSCSIYDSVTGALVDGPEGVSASSATEATADYTIAFESFAWTVDAGETEKLLMKCDLANVALDDTDAASDTYKFYLQTTNGVPLLVAEDEDGDSVDGSYDSDGSGTVDTSDDTEHDTVAANIPGVPILTVAASGTLTITAASDMPTSTIVLGSSTGVSIAKYKFTSANEAFVVDKMAFYNCYDTDGTSYDGLANDCNDGTETSGADNVATLLTASYTNSDGVTETKTGYFTGSKVTFTGMDFYVGENASAYVTITADTSAVSTTGATSGTLVAASLTKIAGDLSAVGQGSGTTLTGTTVTYTAVASNEMTLYKTKPTISPSSGTPSGAVYNGANDVFHFTVSADSRGYVTLNEVTFALSSTDQGASDWNTCDTTASAYLDEPDMALYDIADLGTALDADGDWSFFTTSGAACTTGHEDVLYIVVDDADAAGLDTIAAGSSVTYALYMTVASTGANASNDDTLRITLETNANSATGSSAHAGTDGTINWEDDSATTELYASLLKTLPVRGNSLTF